MNQQLTCSEFTWAVTPTPWLVRKLKHWLKKVIIGWTNTSSKSRSTWTILSSCLWTILCPCSKYLKYNQLARMRLSRIRIRQWKRRIWSLAAALYNLISIPFLSKKVILSFKESFLPSRKKLYFDELFYVKCTKLRWWGKSWSKSQFEFSK